MLRPFKIKFYKRIPDRYVSTLMNKFSYYNGELRPAHQGGHIVQVAIAKSKHGMVVGWCAVYKSIRDFDPICGKDYSLGIFVNYKYRHRGVGGFLRRKAIKWCFRKGLKVWWFRDGYDATLATKDDFKYIDEEKTKYTMKVYRGTNDPGPL